MNRGHSTALALMPNTEHETTQLPWSLNMLSPHSTWTRVYISLGSPVLTELYM